MNTARAQSLVILSAGIAAGLTTLAALTNGKKPPAKVYIGAGVYAIAATTLAEFAPQLAGALAGVVIITAVFGLGSDAYAGLSKTLK
jgi:hypothetical protein